LLRDIPGVHAVGYRDREGIVAAIRNVREAGASHPVPPEEAKARFTRRSQAEILHGVLEDAISRGAAR
jgi:hypothetical protein